MSRGSHSCWHPHWYSRWHWHWYWYSCWLVVASAPVAVAVPGGGTGCFLRLPRSSEEHPACGQPPAMAHQGRHSGSPTAPSRAHARQPQLLYSLTPVPASPSFLVCSLVPSRSAPPGAGLCCEHSSGQAPAAQGELQASCRSCPGREGARGGGLGLEYWQCMPQTQGSPVALCCAASSRVSSAAEGPSERSHVRRRYPGGSWGASLSCSNSNKGPCSDLVGVVPPFLSAVGCILPVRRVSPLTASATCAACWRSTPRHATSRATH